jgi:hypothetical protein
MFHVEKLMFHVEKNKPAKMLAICPKLLTPSLLVIIQKHHI